MMTIKTMWFYAALAAALCGGAGIGAGVVSSMSPSQAESAVRQAQLSAMQNCEMTEADRAYRRPKFKNSPAKEY